MVTTASASWTDESLSALGLARDISMPTSAIAVTTEGWTSSAGALPADRTRTLPAAYRSSSAAAIWLRPAFWTQMNRTVGRLILGGPVGTPRRDGTEHRAAASSTPMYLAAPVRSPRHRAASSG